MLTGAVGKNRAIVCARRALEENMTKQERLERFNELTRTYGVRELADMVIQLEEHCEKADAEKAKLRAKLEARASR